MTKNHSATAQFCQQSGLWRVSEIRSRPALSACVGCRRLRLWRLGGSNHALMPKRQPAKVQRITPFLWFNGNAEEAATFYVSIFKRSKITRTVRFGEAGPGAKGTVMTVEFQLEGMRFVALNGGPQFTFSPATSFFVSCTTQAEVDLFWRRLSKGGTTMQCGWLTDRFGLTWQIIPEELPQLIAVPAAMRAMMGMVKIDLKKLRAAAGITT
jgi:predicted 3-demethylubiquinone-9 3-methyltransferase (glyoxalase superfamily)